MRNYGIILFPMKAKLSKSLMVLVTVSLLATSTLSIHAQDISQLANRARVNLYEKWNFDSVAYYFDKVIGKEGAPATAYSDYGWYLMLLDRDDEGHTYIEKAAKMAPDDRQMITWYAWALFWRKDLAKAQQWINKALVLDPNYGEALYVNSLIFSTMGKHQEALQSAEKAAANDAMWRGGVPLALARAGHREKAYDRAEKIAKDESVFDCYLLIETFGVLGDDDRALDYLEKAFALWAPFLPWLKFIPDTEHLHTNPRFQAVVRKMDLPK